ncbi:hypothetical protein ACFQH6_18750 [Halobacteriaceae archaeon GCM10025711]
MNDTLVATATARSPTQVVELNQGVPLEPSTASQRRELRAFQISTAGERSPEPPYGVETTLRPSEDDLRPLAWATPLYRCARCLQLHGAFPGADVRVIDASGDTLAHTETLETVARVGLNRQLEASDELTATQTACGEPGEESLAPELASEPSSLPPPTIRGPLVECGRKVYVGDVYPGATVVLSRSEGPDRRACFDQEELFFEYGESDPLEPGETVSARQEHPECDVEGEGEGVDTRDVDLTEALPTPSIDSTPCGVQPPSD